MFVCISKCGQHGGRGGLPAQAGAHLPAPHRAGPRRRARRAAARARRVLHTVQAQSVLTHYHLSSLLLEIVPEGSILHNHHP